MSHVLTSSPKKVVYTCPVDHEGTSLFVRGWLADGRTYYPLILVHDLWQSSEVYEDLAVYLCQQGFNVYAYDLRGHGQSGSRLGHIESFEILARDLLQVVAWIKHIHGGIKPIIIGQGFGGIVGLYFARGFPKFAKAMVLASPTINLIKTVRPYHRLIIKTLAELLPAFQIPNRICPVFSQSFGKKNKNRFRLTNFTVLELLNAISQARKLLMRVSLPTLFLCPEKDPVTRFDGLKRILSKNKKNDRMQIQYLDMDTHAVLTLPLQNIQSALSVLVPWLTNYKIKTVTKSLHSSAPTSQLEQTLM